MDKSSIAKAAFSAEKIYEIGIMPQQAIRDHVLDVANGKVKPEDNRPTLWFPSEEALNVVRNDPNHTLHALVKASEQNIMSLSILELAEDVFTHPDQAQQWLNMPHLSLSGRKPNDLVNTDDEHLVRNVLLSLKYGGVV